ncbi:MAG TPA: cyclic-di-AMP receptor [Tissierellaceae bacterium]|nr:cyclic-di-AMP receptor [Tissierellaceae bacterium]
MKLLIAIIQDEYVNKVGKALIKEKIRSTKLSSSGGFLRSGNTTLLIGTEEENIPNIIETIEEQTKSTKVQEGDQEVTVGAANIFVVDMADHVKL